MDIPSADQLGTFPEESPKVECSNCGKKMAKKGKFCPHCGQKRFEGKIPIRELTSKFLYKVTNLDNKLIRMLWRLFIPGQVSLDYFAGKIKQYPHPFQFFFVVMFFFLLVFNKVTDSGKKGINFNFSVRETEFTISPDTAQTRKIESSKKNDFYFQLEQRVFEKEFLQAYDSLPTQLQTPNVKEALTFIVEQNQKRWSSELDSIFDNEEFRDSITISLISKTVRIAYRDVVEYSPDEIVERYRLEDWLSKVMVKQGIRSIQNPDDLITAYIGSFSWTILALIIAMAGCLYLFYWPQKRYYVEHFILLLHWHSGVFLGLTLLMLLNLVLPLGPAWALVIVFIMVYLWLSMKRFYRQNWFWTSFKWFWFWLFYTLGFAIFFTLGIVAVFTLF